MKRLLLSLLAMTISVSLAACAHSEATPNTAGISSNSSFSSDTGTRIITDSYGRQVEIPDSVDRIIPLGNAPRMVTYLGLADRVVAVPQCEHPDSPIMAYAYVNRDLWKDLPNVGNDSLGAGEWYAEEIVASAPDVIFCTYEADIADDIQNQTGIPVVAVTSPTLFSEEYNDSMRIIAEACGVSERADELISYLQSCLADLKGRTQDIPDENKPSVLGAGATFKGGHSIDGVYANYPVFEILSAKDAAAGISEKSGGLLVDKEQILSWDPDMIFFDAGSMELVRTDYAEDAAFFDQLKAVQSGELYQWPNSTWHSSNVEIPLASAYYVGSLLYPEAFSDMNIEEKISEIFDMFLGAPDYLTILEEAGYGYQKVTLGE